MVPNWRPANLAARRTRPGRAETGSAHPRGPGASPWTPRGQERGGRGRAERAASRPGPGVRAQSEGGLRGNAPPSGAQSTPALLGGVQVGLAGWDSGRKRGQEPLSPTPEAHFLTVLHTIPGFNCCTSGLPGPSTAHSTRQQLFLEAPLHPLCLPVLGMGPMTPSQPFPACCLTQTILFQSPHLLSHFRAMLKLLLVPGILSVFGTQTDSATPIGSRHFPRLLQEQVLQNTSAKLQDY
eukprot:XP_022273678.1 uncharacterized protein LOC111095682 [Canis lupus familiaris]